ncbi:MAG: acylneuraminate cytidylyltransferase family protein [Gemmatimonadaceae bacterium]|nr:acylneuraminate cytidylyltransferase family protein [Gemmatimonadaceae bacterium]
MRVLGLIPARGGSKSVEDKNLRPMLGKPLIQRAHETAIESQSLARVILSTDDARIAEAGRRAGIDVPFMRPAELAQDASAMIAVAVHALETLAAFGEQYDALLLLQPTSPLRRPAHITTAIDMLGDWDAVCSVVPVPQHLCPHYVMRISPQNRLEYFLPDGGSYTRRQDVPSAYRRDGTIFLTRTAIVLGAKSFYGTRCAPLLLTDDDSLSIDEPADWAEAERRLLTQR